MSFKNIIGQKKIIQILKNAIYFNKVAHAYIFAGNNGIGKKKTAIEFAKALNCDEFLETKDSCENCKNCKKITKNIHPDIILFKSENKNISIDEIRDIQKILQYKNYESKYRVLIIEDADNLTSQAANAFLKTLEEPPINTVIILIVDNLSSMLKTILSRCQIIKFKNLTIEEKIEIIQNNSSDSFSKNYEEIKNSLLICTENISDTINFIESKDNENLIEKFNFINECIIKKDFSYKVQKELESISKDKEIFSKFLDFIINKNSDVFLQKTEFINLLLKAKKYFNYNVNPRLIWNWMFLEILNLK
jgi:DNA polymerase III subunit delta'